MEPIRHEPEMVTGIEVLTFNQVELEKIKADGSQAFATIGNLNVLYFDYYERFVLQLNNWRYALIPRLPLTALADNGKTQAYILPAYDGTYKLKLSKLSHHPASLLNFETILSHTTKFSCQEQRQEILVRQEEEYISTSCPYQSSYVSLQRVSIEPSPRQAEFSSLGASNYSGSTAHSLRKRDKLKRKLRGMFGKKNSPFSNPNLTQERDFESLRKTNETMAPLYEFRREEIETVIVSARGIARKLEQPKEDSTGDMKQKVMSLVERVKEGVHDMKDKIAARHSRDTDEQKPGFMARVKEGIQDMKEILTGKGHDENIHTIDRQGVQSSINPSASSQIDFETIWKQHNTNQTADQISASHPYTGHEVTRQPREKLRIFDQKYLDQPIPAPILPQTIESDRQIYSGIPSQYHTSEGYHHEQVREVPIHESPQHINETNLESSSLAAQAKSLIGCAISSDGSKKSQAQPHTGVGIGPSSGADLLKTIAPVLLSNYVSSSVQTEANGVKGIISGILPVLLKNKQEEQVPIQSLSTNTQPPSLMDKVKAGLPFHGGSTIHEDPTPIQNLDIGKLSIPEASGPSLMDKVKASIPVLKQKVETKIPVIKEKIIEIESKIESKLKRRHDIAIQTDDVDLVEVNTTSTYIPQSNPIQSETMPHNTQYPVLNNILVQNLPTSLNQQAQSDILGSQNVTPLYEQGNIQTVIPIQHASTADTDLRNYPEASQVNISQEASTIRSGKYSKHLPDTSSVSRSNVGASLQTRHVERIHEESLAHYQA